MGIVDLHRMNGWQQCGDLTYPVVISREESHVKILWDTHQSMYRCRDLLELFLVIQLQSLHSSCPLISTTTPNHWYPNNFLMVVVINYVMISWLLTLNHLCYESIVGGFIRWYVCRLICLSAYHSSLCSSTHPCEKFLSSLHVVARVNDIHRSTNDLMDHTCSDPYTIRIAPISVLCQTSDTTTLLLFLH